MHIRKRPGTGKHSRAGRRDHQCGILDQHCYFDQPSPWPCARYGHGPIFRRRIVIRMHSMSPIRIPNLLRDLFAEGALSAAFVPTFIRRLTQDGKEQAWLLANRVISALLVILGALTLSFFSAPRNLFIFWPPDTSVSPKNLN